VLGYPRSKSRRRKNSNPMNSNYPENDDFPSRDWFVQEKRKAPVLSFIMI
jgi:hypothetical protein